MKHPVDFFATGPAAAVQKAPHPTAAATYSVKIPRSLPIHYGIFTFSSVQGAARYRVNDRVIWAQLPRRVGAVRSFIAMLLVVVLTLGACIANAADVILPAPVAGGGGSGTVNSGTTNQLAVYPSNGTAVQGVTVGGDCTHASGAFTCTKSSGNAFTSSTFGASLNLSTLLSQDCTIMSSGVTTCLKTNNVPFGSFATLSAVTTDATLQNNGVSGSALGLNAAALSTGQVYCKGASAIGPCNTAQQTGTQTAGQLPVGNGDGTYHPLAPAGNLRLPTDGTANFGIVSATPMFTLYLGDGSESDPNGSVSAQGVHSYANLTIPVGQTLTVTDTVTAAAPDLPHGAFIAYVPGTCTIAGTIAANGIRNAVNTGANGGGSGGGGGGAKTAGSGTVGIATSWFNASSALTVAAGGTAGGVATNGGAGNAVTAITQKWLWNTGAILFAASMGGANGGAGNAGDGTAGTAGAGGGGVVLICGTINFTGTISVAGANGGSTTTGTANCPGGGGGGGGGVVLTYARSYTANTGTITTSAGSGGTLGGSCVPGAGGNGGNGGAGWSKQLTGN